MRSGIHVARKRFATIRFRHRSIPIGIWYGEPPAAILRQNDNAARPSEDPMLRPTSRIAPRAAITAALTFLTLVLGARAGMAETFAYVGNADSNDISVFKLAESGEM